MTPELKDEMLTAYVLGELSAEDKSRVEKAMHENPGVNNEVLESKEFINQLREELAAETAPTFSNAQRNALDARFELASTAKGRARMILEKPIYTLGRGARMGLIAGAAAAMTIALFFTMSALIKSGDGVSTDPLPKVASIEVVRPPEPEEIVPEESKLPKFKADDAPPPPTVPVGPTGPGNNTVIIAPPIGPPTDTAPPVGEVLPSSPLTPPTDATAIPVFRVQPIYPEIARQQRLEGWVRIQFTINTEGKVKDPVVISSSNEVFDRAAVQALKKWKYKPKVENGNAIETHGVTIKLMFELEDA